MAITIDLPSLHDTLVFAGGAGFAVVVIVAIAAWALRDFSLFRP